MLDTVNIPVLVCVVATQVFLCLKDCMNECLNEQRRRGSHTDKGYGASQTKDCNPILLT